MCVRARTQCQMREMCQRIVDFTLSRGSGDHHCQVISRCRSTGGSSDSGRWWRSTWIRAELVGCDETGRATPTILRLQGLAIFLNWLLLGTVRNARVVYTWQDPEQVAGIISAGSAGVDTLLCDVQFAGLLAFTVAYVDLRATRLSPPTDIK